MPQHEAVPGRVRAAPGRGWDAFLTGRDKAVFGAAGFGVRGGLGTRPVLLVVDVTYGFCGDRPEPILDSMTRWRNSCGETAWAAIPRIERLCRAARAAGARVVFTRGAPRRADGADRGRWNSKNSRHTTDTARSDEIVAEVPVRPADVIIEKTRPSAFFATPLPGYLVEFGADSLIVCGATTSGCVRATVVDGFSYGYRTAVALEATFDRGEASHWLSLFDLDMKYADVTPVAELEAYLGGLTG